MLVRSLQRLAFPLLGFAGFSFGVAPAAHANGLYVAVDEASIVKLGRAGIRRHHRESVLRGRHRPVRRHARHHIGADKLNSGWIDTEAASDVAWEDFSNGVNVLDLYDELRNRNWAGCVRARNEPFDGTDEPPSAGNPELSSRPISRRTSPTAPIRPTRTTISATRRKTRTATTSASARSPNMTTHR